MMMSDASLGDESMLSSLESPHLGEIMIFLDF